MQKIMLTSLFGASLILTSGMSAAQSTANGAVSKQAGEPSGIDKLVGNQPAASVAASHDTTAEKPMTINFSDFVKDGAGCGVPNLDTSGK